MLIPPNVLNVAGCASRDSARFQLCGIYLERKGDRKCAATATDGKTLAHVTWAEDDPRDFPERGVNALPAEPGGTIIPIEAVKEIQALAPKHKPWGKPILENVAMDEHTLNGTATFLGTDLKNDRKLCVRTTEGTYPDYQKALESVPVASVRVDPFYLIQALQTFTKTMGWKASEPTPTCELELCGEKPIAIRGKNFDLEVTTLVMPLIEAPRH